MELAQSSDPIRTQYLLGHFLPTRYATRGGSKDWEGRNGLETGEGHQEGVFLKKGNTNIVCFSLERRHRKSMTRPSVHVQIAPTSVPSTPSWLGEVAVFVLIFFPRGPRGNTP